MMHHLLSFLFAILILQTPTKLNAVDLAAEETEETITQEQPINSHTEQPLIQSEKINREADAVAPKKEIPAEIIPSAPVLPAQKSSLPLIRLDSIPKDADNGQTAPSLVTAEDPVLASAFEIPGTPEPYMGPELTVASSAGWMPYKIKQLYYKHIASPNQKPIQKRRRLGNLLGTFHPKIHWLIDQLRRCAIYKRKPALLSNRLILYGPPGNGKSTLARTIATEAGCEFMSLNGPSIVGSYLGEGAEKIRKLFTDAEKRFNETGKPVILFIDEIDAICRANINYEAPSRAEHQVATQELWIHIDKYKHHPGIFLICATNHFDKLDRTFLDRFNTNTIEIPNPDSATRKLVFTHYLTEYRVNLDEPLIDNLVKASDGMSIRALEDFARDIAVAPLMYNNITEGTIWHILAHSRAKDAAGKKAQDPYSDSWLRKTVDATALALNLHTLWGVVRHIKPTLFANRSMAQNQTTDFSNFQPSADFPSTIG